MLDGVKPRDLGGSYALGVGAIALLIVAVVLGAYLGTQTNAQFREVKQSWSDYARDAGRKGVWISEIRGHLGYGGIIHNFKNYVLRQEAVYLNRARNQLDQFDTVIQNYLSEPLLPEEREALETIQATVAEYESKIPIARTAAREGKDIVRTDARVKVDDQAAIQAFQQLESIWRSKRQSSTRRIKKAVEQGQRLIWIGYLSGGGLAAAALALASMIVLLMRNMWRANERSYKELRVRARLEESEGRLAEAVEQSPATIFITDTNARILYTNQRFETITGWRRDEVEGHTPRFLQSGDTPPEIYAEIREQLQQKQAWHGIFRNIRKDGSSYWADTTILPLIGPDGRVQNFLGIAEDITEKRKAREQVARAQKLEAVGLLAGGIAHDFNNILTMIIGAAHLAHLDAPKDSDVAAEIEQIDISARRAQSLVQELLAFARREPGHPKATDLRALIEEVRRLVRASTPATITLHHEVCDEQLFVMVDPTHLHQILMNLYRNAVEAVGGNEGTISVTARRLQSDDVANLDARAAGWVRLDVADNGPGMSAGTQKKAFDPFFTTKPMGKGSGLGLAVVQGLVQEISGSISVASSPSSGTCFSLLLPGADPVAEAPGQPAEVMPEGRERIMLVDDEPDVASTVRRILLRLGYQVEAFTDPAVAHERFRRDPARFDLLITDMVMPEMNGAQLATAARALRPNLPVVIVTGYRVGKVDVPGAPASILDKPMAPVALAQCIRQVLDQSTA